MAALTRLVAMLLLVAATTTAQSGCPVQCRSCDNDRILCSQAGLASIPQTLPQESLTVDFSHNAITSLNRLPNLPNTMSMRLAGNQITSIKGGSFKNVPQLMSLDLAMNKIRKLYKQGFKGLDNIMTLTLNGNMITTIGKVFMNTPELTSLRLSFNKITEIEEDSFENNKMLKMLDLSNNVISRIHPNAFKNLDMLRILILSNNPLGTLPELTFTTNILTLADFTNCELTAVPRIMPSSLNDFRLGNNKITKINADDFNNMTELNLLTLNDNAISDVEHRSFYYLEKLMELWMSRNSMVYIPRGLPTHLEKFHIDNNQVVELEPMLFKDGAMLKVMSLESNKVNKIHKDALKQVKHIEDLNLQGNEILEIETGTFTDLANFKKLSMANNPLRRVYNGAFVNLGNLTDLSLAYIEGLKTPGQPIVSENILSQMPNLENLDLMSSIELTKDLVEQFNDYTTPFSKIKRVNLQYNDLKSLPETVKQVFINADLLLLDGNMFICDKRLVWLNTWMKTSIIQFHQQEQPICHGSGNLDGRPISELSEYEFIEVSKEENNQENNQDEVAGQQVARVIPDPAKAFADAHRAQETPEVEQPGLSGGLSGNRKQAVSKYDNQGAVSNPQDRSPNIQPPRNNPRPANQPKPNPPRSPSRPYFGTRVIIKPPKNSPKPQGLPADKRPYSSLTKAEKAARKAARKAKRLRDREAKRRAKKGKRHADEVKARKKRRIRKHCVKDVNGVKTCHRLRKKRCKVQDDGSVKCRKRKGGKKGKGRKSKKQKDVSGN